MTPTRTPPNETTRKEMTPRTPSNTVTVPAAEYSSNRIILLCQELQKDELHQTRRQPACLGVN
ncbi:hypothetical protein EYF80_041712 [Liparis tanakae]|uniref:Uncharacterized protein n=1 Tax=Liparis tanakae TaxID=230148 RepID=A0A4Z2G3F0_9TELE|nr:hypothetical protein EYF80_041712 [Liparis tanakae]